MASSPVTVNSRKYDQSIRRSWTCSLFTREDPLLIFVGEFDHDVSHPELGEIRRGTISYEFYWLDRWFNVFRFHEPDGELRNLYFNIAMPPTFENEALDYIDLDIDIVVWPDLSYQVLDRQEFAINADRFGYPDDVRDRVSGTLSHILGIVSAGRSVFDDQRDWMRSI
jgi:uncharacterized protein